VVIPVFTPAFTGVFGRGVCQEGSPDDETQPVRPGGTAHAGAYLDVYICMYAIIYNHIYIQMKLNQFAQAAQLMQVNI